MINDTILNDETELTKIESKAIDSYIENMSITGDSSVYYITIQNSGQLNSGTITNYSNIYNVEISNSNLGLYNTCSFSNKDISNLTIKDSLLSQIFFKVRSMIDKII